MTIQFTDMKKQDTDESATQGSEDSPPAAGGTESPAVAKDSSDSNSPKESEPQTPQTNTPPQGEEAASAVAAAALSQCDMAEELSRQLEDILSTYCRETISDDASALPNGQSHSPERNGLTNEKEDEKSEKGKVNGGDSGVEKEQKKTQEKKKVKGLGKEITLLMQTLNTLSTPEEKLAGLCKKYAELLEEHRNTQKQMKVLQKKQSQLVQEKDNLRNEHSKAILARSKLESLCRELQRHNRTLKEEGMQRTRLEEEKRKEVTSHFQVTLNDIQTQMEQHNERNASLRQENTELAEKLKKLYEQYKLREELLKEAVESQRMCELMKQQEVHLKQQLSLYTEKFEEFQTTLSKSNEVFTTFKQEMEKMTKKIKKLEKETAMYRSRWESSNKALLEMAEEKAVRDREFEALQGKVQRLEKLRRALKVERNELNKKVQNLSGQQGGTAGASASDPGTDSPSPPPTDSLLEPNTCPIPDSAPCSHSCHCDPELDTDPLLEEANAQPKPILLQGHERSITQIKYNREGDLLFSVAKDTVANVWYSVNGERLGTYNGHTGAVWCVDCDCIPFKKYKATWDTKNVLTGSADNSCRLWDCETGKQLALLHTNSAVRTCGFDFSGNIIMFSTDKQMGYQCYLNFFDLRDPQQIDDNQPYLSYPAVITRSLVLCGGLWESLSLPAMRTEKSISSSGEILKKAKEHTKQINDIQTSVDLTMFISASKDNTAKLFDCTSLDHIKTFKTERPVNSAAISPIMDHVVMGGGQEAMEVTTTSTRIGKFEASYSSGGEDGYVRIHYFDPQYFDFELEA
ncbi:hypothetical protein INR49_023780 [Caranx melampygus]|nr:hypothetical protein INR49_023780 [Caranx melampygus]